MRRRGRIGRASAAVLVATLVACAGHRMREPEMPLPPGVAEAPKGLKFSIKVTPTTFKLGQRVSLEATMFNDAEKRFERSFPTTCTWGYEVASASGRVLGPERTCEPADSQIVLEPGELRMIMREWSGNDRYFSARERLTPGFYKITAGFVDEYQRVIPMADPVTIQVLPR
jgi:hypothetical protein